MAYKDACYFAKTSPLVERRRQSAKNIFVKMQDSKRTLYNIYFRQYNEHRLDTELYSDLRVVLPTHKPHTHTHMM